MAQSQFNPPSDVVSERRKQYEAKYSNQDQSKGYSIGTLEYPEGLRVQPDLQHYVAFYINVRDKATGGKNNNPDKDHFVSNDEQKRIDALNTSRIAQGAFQAGIKTVADNAAIIAGAGTFLGSVGLKSKLRDLPGAVAKAYAAATIAKTSVHMLEKIDPIAFKSGATSRLKEVITLHVEDRPSVKYGANYTEKELGSLTGMLVEGSAAATAGQFKSMLPEMQARIVSDLIKLPSLKAGGGTLNDLRELGTRTRTNPFREVLFDSVDYRTFSFRYRFFPKSRNETEKIRKIIDTFKIHMHPELTAGKLFYIYPSEFDIQYFFKDKENDYLHKFAKCALTDMQVEYGGEQFATFDNGAPVEIGLTLTFRELEQMTSEGIKSYGY